MKTVILLLLLVAQSALAEPHARPFPPEERCSRVWIRFKSFWEMHCFSNGAAAISDGNLPSLRTLPKGSIDFANIYRELTALPAPDHPDSAVMFVTFVLRESAPQPDGVRTYEFTFADAEYAQALFRRIMDTPGGYRWKELDEHIARNPPFAPPRKPSPPYRLPKD